MKLEGYKLVFVAIGFIGILLIASPTLADLIHAPTEEKYSELYLLGSEKSAANYPFNIAVAQNNSIYVGVRNHLGSSGYYVLYVKFGNETDLLPTREKPSSLSPLYEYRVSIQDNLNWESSLTFSVSSASISGNKAQINTLQINGVAFNVDKHVMWDSNSTTFKYQLFFELWLYNSSSKTVLYNDRFVNLQLNLTSSKGSG
jgi:uncharacterized membrane protein